MQPVYLRMGSNRPTVVAIGLLDPMTVGLANFFPADFERQKAALRPEELASFEDVWRRFVLFECPFEAHKSRLSLGQWREVTTANKLKLKRSLLHASKNKLANITDTANLLTGYTTAEPCLAMPKSWFDAGKYAIFKT